MRLTPEQLQEITGKRTGSAQCRWFRAQFGDMVPSDRRGPILTAAAFEALLARRLGFLGSGGPTGRPAVRLLVGGAPGRSEGVV